MFNFNKINIYISIVAGIIYTLASIYLRESLSIWLPNIIFVLVLFYLLGSAFKKYIKDNIFDEVVDDDFEFYDDEHEDIESLENSKNIFDDLDDE